MDIGFLTSCAKEKAVQMRRVLAGRFSRLGLGLGLTLLLGWGLGACSTAPPQGVQAVSPFELKRYLGNWYEIGRLDHRFERGLSRVSASYSMNSDGSVKVLNRGYNAEKGAWSEAEGRAVFTGDPRTASLKVSFFGPFYGGYHVIALDADYQWAMVIGPDPSYLWILSREATLSAEVRERLVSQAASAGVDTRALIWVDQKPFPG
jgi:apolipoprotein D and lipocalin family protein